LIAEELNVDVVVVEVGVDCVVDVVEVDVDVGSRSHIIFSLKSLFTVRTF
jgi:hypothetical protein